MTHKSDNTTIHNGLNNRGASTVGLVLSVVLAVAIVGLLAYHLMGPDAGGSNLGEADGISGSPLLGAAEMTRKQVDQMNRQRSDISRAAGVTRHESNDLTWRAERDCRDIATGLQAFKRDVGAWPVRSASDDDEVVDFLYGVGRVPRFDQDARESWGARSEDLHSYLVSNGPEKEGFLDYFKHVGGRFENWTGPYLPHESADPWGSAYVVSVSGFDGGSKPGNSVWCLSAGPDGQADTPADEDRVYGDDVGYMIK